MGVFGVYIFEYKTKALLQDLVVVCSAGMSVQSSALLLAAVSPWVRHHNFNRGWSDINPSDHSKILTIDINVPVRSFKNVILHSNVNLDSNVGEAADGGSRR